ncbi:Protein timeless [Eumeta japonica]|uniref:Protein timeless n=1 Tax=Eumeta variegata TaxID=151549 RepID=A0A4C1VPK2_EUMVA|nr:Protein timeless [Eumeta japonica]
MNLTIPVECLLSVETLSKSDCGRQTIFEVTNLLKTAKHAFSDHRTTKVVVDFVKKNFETQDELTLEQSANINYCLLLLRNILHIPEELKGSIQNERTLQNQIVWNVFSQSLDKVLTKLMVMPEAYAKFDRVGVSLHDEIREGRPSTAIGEENRCIIYDKVRGHLGIGDMDMLLHAEKSSLWLFEGDCKPTKLRQNHWSVTVVQLIALFYKDQHVVTLHKLLNLWLEATLSESSEDNESNTSPPGRGSEDSMPILTSDPTSDSSDTGGSGKSNDEQNIMKSQWNDSSTMVIDSNLFKKPTYFTDPSNTVLLKEETQEPHFETKDHLNQKSIKSNCVNIKKKILVSENSDCGYGTQIENQESISTSSNEDELPAKKPFYQKPHNSKQRVNLISRAGTLQERKRKKIVRRGKCNSINIHGLLHKTPTNDDISNILKEFTVDFLLKGYNSLVQTIYEQIITNLELEIDTAHFFWLVTYFLKFAAQIELDLEHLDSVLSYEIICYLTAEGVVLCEQLELALKSDGSNLKQCIRKLHLLVTAIKEFVQTIETYKKLPHLSNEDKETIKKLQLKICETEELRSLLVFLLMHYNSFYLNKQYLQDWSDLIEYVINTFVQKPLTVESLVNVRIESPNLDENTNIIKSSASCSETPPERNLSQWNTEEISSLNWIYMQCSSSADVIGETLRLLEDDGIVKSRKSIIKELYQQNIISSEQREEFMKNEVGQSSRNTFSEEDMRDDETNNLCEQLRNDGKTKFLHWVQMVLLDICFARIYLDKNPIPAENTETNHIKSRKVFTRDVFIKKSFEIPVMSPVSYHSLVSMKPVPLVPWNCEQAAICKDLKFLQLLNKLGFHMPIDTGRIFIEIPHIWTAEFLYEVASKIGPVDTKNLKFCLNDIHNYKTENRPAQYADVTEDICREINALSSSENTYKVYTSKHVTTMVNFTPTPSSSFAAEAEEKFNKENWLELVKKSQDCKLSLNITRVPHLTHRRRERQLFPAISCRANTGKRSPLYHLVDSYNDHVASIDVMAMRIDRISETRSAYFTRSEAAPLLVEGGVEHFNCGNAASGPSNRPLSPSHVTSAVKFKEDIAVDNESENNSVCETATTASDLTRMYVSDEDEKLDGEASKRVSKLDTPNERPTKRRRIRLRRRPGQEVSLKNGNVDGMAVNECETIVIVSHFCKSDPMGLKNT